ncbi:MAG: Tn7 transposase TnsA N-terminal domain-containing protein [Methylocella sp.]
MRRIQLSRRSHVVGVGSFESGLVEYESALERDFALVVSFDDPGAVIVSQPMTIWFDAGDGRRRYTPDFSVKWSDGRFDLVEIKYRVDLRADWSRLRPGFLAARDAARGAGGRFRIVTERSIRGPWLENARRLLPLRRAPLDHTLAEMAKAIVLARLLTASRIAAPGCWRWPMYVMACRWNWPGKLRTSCRARSTSG